MQGCKHLSLTWEVPLKSVGSLHANNALSQGEFYESFANFVQETLLCRNPHLRPQTAHWQKIKKDISWR